MSISEKENYREERKLSGIQQFFIVCSGADTEILNKCPSEWNKFVGIGATIFFTAALAVLSGGYAISFTFENVWISICFGIFWGFVIFNLDRYIVLSLRKEIIPTQKDIHIETDNAKKEELKIERKRLRRNLVYMASPRIIIALIIAFTVSKPIELRLFNGRIEKELENTVNVEDKRFDEEEKQRIDALNNKLTAINNQEEKDKTALFSNNPIYKDAKDNIPTIEKNITSKEASINTNNKIIAANKVKETRHRTISDPETGIKTNIPYIVWLDNATALAKKHENEQLYKDIAKLKTELSEQKDKLTGIETTLIKQSADISKRYESTKNNITQQIDELKRTYIIRKTAWTNANRKSVELSARLEALGNISQFSINPVDDNFGGDTIWWASFVITLLFISLETAPVIVKLLTKRGPYDEILDRVEYEHLIHERELISRKNSEINELLVKAEEAAKLRGDAFIQAQKSKLDAELNNNKIITDKIAKYQQELALLAIEKWREEELKKMKTSSVSSYTKTTTT
ncbi:hypothetical protein EZS27_011137 [termite gut metagenome]|uniref:DUF4407 domain-containing protein n=1 Tax=termite gut metagenome TaxID=433724 RepID=A0A5J4S4S0_9ZZZZ